MELSRTFPSLLVGAAIVMVQPQAVRAISAPEVAQIAQSITVKIENPDSRSQGSGIILKKDGDSYYVLTAFHVVRKPAKYTLIAPDGKEYQIDYKTVKKGMDVDLAILQFNSDRVYKIAKIGDSDKSTLGTTSYVAGFPAATAAFPVSALRFLEGKITANASIQVDDGYTLVYSNNTLGGMSGGPVFNEEGEVIAVHGRAETVSDRDKDNPKPVSTGNNLGIPINTFLRLAMVDVGVKAPASVVATAPKADDFYLEGNGKVETGDYRGAVESYSQAIEINPQYADAYNNRGAMYGILGEYQQEIADYDRAIEINPQLAQAYYNRGIAHRALGDKQQALSDYSRAIEINPQYADAYNNRGNLYVALRDKQKAISDYNRAIEINPQLAQAYNNRGIAYRALGDKQKAISDYNRAIEINPQSANAYYNRGLAYRALGDKQRAIADLTEAAKLYQRQGKTADYQDALDRIRQIQEI